MFTVFFNLITRLTLEPLNTTIVVYNLLYLPIISQILGTKCVFGNQYLQMLRHKLIKYE